jgi:phosphoglycolate phosphatase
VSVGSDKLKVKAVLFDLDGTLIDSIHVYFKLVDVVLERLNLPPVSSEKIVQAGEDGEFNWDIVLPDEVKDQKDKIISQAWDIINDIAPQMFRENVKLIPGSDEILKKISSDGIKIGLVTSTIERYMQVKIQPLKQAGIEQLFEVIITADDVPKRKPAPDPLIECGSRLGVAPDESSYVGDARIDIRAGKAAGMKTVGVLTGFDDYESLKKENPDAIINSIDELPNTIAFQNK